MKTSTSNKQSLQQIPGVGPAIARMLQVIGIQSPRDLCGQDPEDLYRRYEEHVGHHVDRCVLYVFRCAVYYCETSKPEPDLLKWWNWKDTG